MDDQQRSEFRIRLNEEDRADTSLLNDMMNQRIDKLRHRITLFTVLIPLLLGGVLFFGYLEVKQRLGNFEHTGSNGVETLSQDLESRFSSLSVKLAKIEADFTARIAAAEKSTLTLQNALGKTGAELHTALKTLADAKIDKKALSDLSAALDAKTAALQKNLTRVSSELETMETGWSEELTAVNGDMDLMTKRLAEIQDSVSELAALSERRLDHKELEGRLKAQRQDFQNQVDELTTLLNRNDDKIELLMLQIKGLEKVFSQLAAPGPTAPRSGTSANATAGFPDTGEDLPQ